MAIKMTAFPSNMKALNSYTSHQMISSFADDRENSLDCEAHLWDDKSCKTGLIQLLSVWFQIALFSLPTQPILISLSQNESSQYCDVWWPASTNKPMDPAQWSTNSLALGIHEFSRRLSSSRTLSEWKELGRWKIKTYQRYLSRQTRQDRSCFFSLRILNRSSRTADSLEIFIRFQHAAGVM